MAEMYGVDFGDDNNEFEIKSRKILGEKVRPSMITFLRKIGLAKNDSQAVSILTVVFIAALAGAYFLSRPPQYEVVITADGREIKIEAYIEALNNGINLADE